MQQHLSLATLVALLAFGMVGLASSGCGGDGDASSSATPNTNNTTTSTNNATTGAGTSTATTTTGATNNATTSTNNSTTSTTTSTNNGTTGTNNSTTSTNNSTTSTNNTTSDAIARCQAVCDAVAQCAELRDACGVEVVEDYQTLCRQTCQDDDDARAQLLALEDLDCGAATSALLDTPPLTDLCAPDPCADVVCDGDATCNPENGACEPEDLCAEVTCLDDERCDPDSGLCVRTPCDDDDACREGEICANETCTAFVCMGDAANDQRATPTRLGNASQLLDGLSICAEDQDWFSIPVPAFHRLTLQLLFAHRLGDLNAELFVQGADQPDQQATSDTDDERLVVPGASQDQELELRVFGVDGAVGDYALDIAIECFDDLEPNDARDDAVLIGTEDTTLNLSICEGDSDWFAITSPPNTSTLVRLRFDETVGDLDAEVFFGGADQPSAVITDNGDSAYLIVSGQTRAHMRVFGVGGALNAYTLEVINAPLEELCVSDDACGDQICNFGLCSPCAADSQCDPGEICGGVGLCGSPCTFAACPQGFACDDATVTCACPADAYEPNASPDDATELTLGGVPDLETTLTDLTICADDADWFAFTQPANTRVEVHITFPHDEGDVDMSVFVPSDPASNGQSRSVTDDELVVVPSAPEARRVEVRVYGYNGALNNYSLTVTSDYTCADGERLPVNDAYCDGVVECADGSDEDCFICDNGQILTDRSRQCDNIAECSDASDEVRCPFTCDDGETLPAEVDGYCDGVTQCADGSDEDCFACDNGQTLPDPLWECNGVEECGDYSDERFCPFICDDGEMLPAEVGAFCDGVVECADGSDEDCFVCDGGYVLPGAIYQCDGTVDCPDGSDEAGCPFVCNNDQLAPPNSYCDGVEQCADGSDEDCFTCDNGDVLPTVAWLCDNFTDCPDSSDEAFCDTCQVAPEDTSWRVACGDGRVIREIRFASYGDTTGVCGAFAQGSCHAETSRAIVEEACLNERTCTIEASNALFGDPCFGVIKTLTAEVVCAF